MGWLFREYGLYMAWLVALVATGGSLYLSEALHWAPCELCWFQRISMYPLVILLGMASYRGDYQIARYVLPLSAIGGIFALLHYLEQRMPGFQVGISCQLGVSCSEQYINWLGFITLPLLSMIAFTMIALLMLHTWWSQRDRRP